MRQKLWIITAPCNELIPFMFKNTSIDLEVQEKAVNLPSSATCSDINTLHTINVKYTNVENHGIFSKSTGLTQELLNQN